MAFIDIRTIDKFYGAAAPRRFGPGDLVVLEPGFTGSWKTISPMRKIYFTTTRA